MVKCGDTCARGHNDWIMCPDGHRRCLTCRRAAKSATNPTRKHHARVRMVTGRDSTPDETYTLSEIRAARGLGRAS